jgi:hypothetical protein
VEPDEEQREPEKTDGGQAAEELDALLGDMLRHMD